MDMTHLHLLLNHWPIIGTFGGFGLFVVALLAKSDDLIEASLVVFSLIALLTIPAYVSGNLAQVVIEAEGSVETSVIATHQGAALLAFLFVEITGALAWVALWRRRQMFHRGRGMVIAVLLAGAATVGVMTIAGNTGGAIHHPELLANPQQASLLGNIGLQLFDAIQYWVADSSRWVWPLLEDAHFIGLALLLGGVGVLDLRVLGLLKRLPVAPLRSFIPWAMGGLAINTMTGMLFFLGMPYFYVYNIDFHIKVFAVVLAGANLLLHCTRFASHWERVGPDEDAPPLAKLLAGSSILLWIAVIVFGRYMPLFEETLTPNI